MELAAYLDRIGYSGDLKVDLPTLSAIHRQHLLTVPYENIDVQLGVASDISIEGAYRKIVELGRGGWCYEMNGLLGWALSEIGFAMTRVCGGVARTFRGDSALGNHLVLLTELNNQTWVVDTGFGDGFFEPIPLKQHTFNQRGFEFDLSQTDDNYWRLKNHQHGGAPDFDFSTVPADENLLAEQCQFLQTNEESPFVLAMVCQRFVEEGYEIQLGRIAKVVRPDGVESRLLETPEELVERLRTAFNLDVPEVAGIWDRIVQRHEELFADKAQ